MPLCKACKTASCGYRQRLCDRCRAFCAICRANPVATKSRYCLSCKAAYMRTHRKGRPLTGEQLRKDRCRSYANVYKQRGKLIQQACEDCGDPNTVMHHTDYSAPLQVVWVCRLHLRKRLRAQ